jgi:lysozyme
MKTGLKGIALIKQFEGCRLTAYLCPSNKPTIGYGNTFYKDGTLVKIGDKITQLQAEELLIDLLPKYEATVNKLKVETQNQYDALVSFCWNCGSSETLFKMVNSKDVGLRAWWESHYIKDNKGNVLQGLLKRRKAEAELFFT